MTSLNAGPSIAAELWNAQLGDKRLNRRLVSIGEKLAVAPASSFPKLFTSDAEQEAFYRLLRNERVTLEKVVGPHILATAQRASQHSAALVIHDTTEFVFGDGDERDGLFELRKNTFGFNAHVSLVVTADGTRMPLGVAGVQTFGKAATDRERWLRQLLAVDSTLCTKTSTLHVMDREADIFPLFSGALLGQVRFIVRAHHNRILSQEHDQARTILEQLDRQTIIATREVALSERRATNKSTMPDEKRRRPPRNSRVATLQIKACPVTLTRPPRQDTSLPEQVRLNVVHVSEADVPADTKAVDWMLLTSEPIGSADEVLAIVDAYRARWVIEEFFKALKTGCAYETRQLESFDTLEVALGLFLPVAWQVLLLRNLGRDDETTAGTFVATPKQIHILRQLCAPMRHHIADDPTARDVMLGIARLGGHIKNNGDPGWQVLWRGLQDLLTAERGFNLAIDGGNVINP